MWSLNNYGQCNFSVQRLVVTRTRKLTPTLFFVTFVDEAVLCGRQPDFDAGHGRTDGRSNGVVDLAHVGFTHTVTEDRVFGQRRFDLLNV